MASVAGIANSALIELGGNRIQSLEDGTPNANTIAEVYDDLRKKALRSHHWNFAISRVKMAKSATDPVFGDQNKFALPSDNIRVVRVSNNDVEKGLVHYRIEEGFITSDLDDIWLQYIKNITDPNTMDPLFREYFSLMIAVKIARKITNSNTVVADVRRAFGSAKREAKSADAIENFPDEQQNGSWFDDRQL